MTQDVEQEQTFVRRRRSGGLAWTGGILAGVGVVLALRPPSCAAGGPVATDPGPWSVNDASLGRYTFTFKAVRLRGECTVSVQVDHEYPWGDSGDSWTMYASDNPRFSAVAAADVLREYNTPVTKRTWNYVGWATAATGGVLLGLGLSSVDVPVRLNVAPGGFRVTHSLGW